MVLKGKVTPPDAAGKGVGGGGGGGGPNCGQITDGRRRSAPSQENVGKERRTGTSPL